MNSRRGLPAAVLFLAALPAFAFQPAPGAMEGRVVNAVSGDPLRKVTLTLTPVGGGDPLGTQNDDSGKFAFRDLAPGTYRLSAERTGYRQQSYGARPRSSVGAPLRVKAGETLGDIVFKLAPNAILSGRVIDENGETLPNLVVTAFRSRYQHGVRKWTQAGAAQTNDRGEFRIGGLEPGRYIVSALDLNIGLGIIGASHEPLPDQPDPGRAQTFYPDTTDVARATPLDLAMGEDRRGADIRLGKTPTLRIRGHIAGMTDDKQVIVTATRKSAATLNSTGGGVGVVQGKEGTFEIRGLAPGSYLLAARTATNITAVGGVASVELSDHHVEGVELALSPGVDLSGTIAGIPADALKKVVARLELIDFSLGDAPTAGVREDGTFVLKNVFAGRYRFQLEGLPDTAWLKSLKANGRASDPALLDLDNAPARLDVTLGAAAIVDGKVLTAEDRPVPNATVVLIPEGGEEPKYRSTNSGDDGSFHLTSVAPGKYKVLAWEDVEPGAWQDAEFVAPYASTAQSVTLAENGRSKLTLKAIPFQDKGAQ